MADWGKVAGYAFTAGIPTVQAVSDIRKGNGVVKSIGKAGMDFAISDVMTGVIGFKAMLIKAGLDVGLEVGKSSVRELQNKGRKVGRSINGTGRMGNGIFVDNEHAATMRQRSLEAIGGHQQIARNALGSEARRRAAHIRY